MKLTVLGLAAIVAALPQQIFRSGVNTVEIYATVVDRDGRHVPDLTKDDFQIYDDTKPVKVDVFAAGTQPITMALMVDESPSVSRVADRIESAVKEFSKHFLPGDRATIGAFSHIVRLDPKLSEKPGDLISMVLGGRPRFPSGTALWDAVDDARNALKGESGRRVVLLLTDADENCSLSDPGEVALRIEREGTMVYAIGVRGNTGLPARDLQRLSRLSGGYYFELRRDDDLTSTLARVADELHRQYVIGFSPATLDGQRHVLAVTSKRPGLTIRARQTYIAAPAGGVGQ
ncbi:MAG TPA: VWA domain-containing protein [Vicinamibacterales bacterium]|nr:VWA domain-containing protein [Vicinamibacterales bacterium]